MKNKFLAVVAILVSLFQWSACASSGKSDAASEDLESGRVVAYVTSWSNVIPDPTAMTHINYAFGHVSESFDSVGIANPERLASMVDLKKDNPELKVLLSIGGWGSGRFSEMAADSVLRNSFAADCRRVVDEYGLDGIDIDWEYPGSNAAGISSSADDKANYTLLMRDIRKHIGDDKLLTLASSAGAEYIDFVSILPYIDFVNVMSYDMAQAPNHHSALYAGEVAKGLTTDYAVKAHINLRCAAVDACSGSAFLWQRCSSLQ